ncbi:putative cytochrome c oxidase subunit 6b-like isoform X2 [Ipomoea triloba]|uniref:putative cytochrome c oxidase subunit 6b-like isoform X2 n=1 Tax=Ipomoea triloba TaxID=35885 RepID=UPI00125D737A|nr:putative cytochrome c oxidase subunit 6b-like isoform X2 [Ipomoea triloba]
MSAAAPLDPHDKMRGRDVNKVARGEQAPRPVHQPGTVSAPPPPSTDSKLDAGKEASANAIGERIRHCYIQFLEYKRLRSGTKREISMGGDIYTSMILARCTD